MVIKAHKQYGKKLLIPGEIGGGWWNAHYADYFLLLTFGGIPWQVNIFFKHFEIRKTMKFGPVYDMNLNISCSVEFFK